ncbi:hypothetical protein FEM48_Zijuj07G0123300 [Ziziphus jujuba var. spinosa]|uniref:N-acetyltransferase domain-containing protein n=1 Tax=Ziziphus jujuba var. spinosa TaxID=714518 RepID=A0A978V4L3_ZIZJJ|nr:hypothetical protein FEM48_Zijuj07G0123300 [Ziziphus jujuba var. spinosa]
MWGSSCISDGKGDVEFSKISLRPFDLSDINRGDDKCRAEIVYILVFKYWGQGIATYAVKLVANAILWEWPHLERLEAFINVENLASQRGLEKAGFQREDILRKYYYENQRRNQGHGFV